MACSQVLNGIAADCQTNVGGVREVYIANYSDVTAIEVDDSSNMIKTITMADTAKFKKYSFKKNTSSMTSTLNVDPANGKYWFLGQEEFVSATAGTAETGTNRSDGNRYTITLTDYSASYPYEVDPSIVAGLIAA